jgi:hypothetical protein
MKLTELVPRESKFSLRLAKREFTMRPINLEDEIWLEETYGIDGILEIFNEMNIKEIARVVFRLIKPEDKTYFAKREVEFITEDGDKETLVLGGVALFKSLISGMQEKEDLIRALLVNIGMSRPDIEEEADKLDGENGKKKAETQVESLTAL